MNSTDLSAGAHDGLFRSAVTVVREPPVRCRRTLKSSAILIRSWIVINVVEVATMMIRSVCAAM
ncbi:hypothetical protein [Streptomyces sp. NPDC002676]